jgi:hypothetical protein
MAKKKKISTKDVERIALEKMAELDPASKEFAQIAENVSKLKEADSKTDQLSKDTAAKCAVYLLGIIALLSFEKFDPITSKVFGKLNFMKLF